MAKKKKNSLGLRRAAFKARLHGLGEQLVELTEEIREAENIDGVTLNLNILNMCGAARFSVDVKITGGLR
jgi:hypothetical protein